MDRKCETDTDRDTPLKTAPNKKCHRKRTRTRKRKVKLNEIKGLESLEITQKVRVKKQRIQCIINVNNIGENYQEDNKTRKRCSHKKSRKYKTDDKVKTTEKHKTDSRSFDKCKTSDKLKTDFSSSFDKTKSLYKHETGVSSFDKSKNSEKYKTDLSSFDKSKSSNKQHNKSFHSSGTINDSLSSENRTVPMCMRDACRPAVSVKSCSCQLKRDKRKLKKIRKREAKANGRDMSLSPISSLSLGGECEISYDNISSDGFTSYDDYDVGNKIDRLIRRTKDRDKRKHHRTNEDPRPISTSTPKRATTTSLPKQGITDSAASLELKENAAVETIGIQDSGDEDSSEICHSTHSIHSIHSQATLILEQIHCRRPSSLEHTEKELGFENDNLYSPTDPTGNDTYSPSISPKNNNEYFHNAIPSYTPCLDVGKTSYSPTLSPEDIKDIFHTVDKRIGDFNYSVLKLSNQSETFSNVTRDPRILSTNSKCNEPHILPTFEENKQAYSEGCRFQNIANMVNNDINQYYYDCNTNMIRQFYPTENNENLFHPISTNQGISEISSSAMPDQSYGDIQSYQYYYYQGMYPHLQSQLPQMQPEMGQTPMIYDNSGLPTHNEFTNNNAYYQWYYKDKENI